MYVGRTQVEKVASDMSKMLGGLRLFSWVKVISHSPMLILDNLNTCRTHIIVFLAMLVGVESGVADNSPREWCRTPHVFGAVDEDFTPRP